MGNGRFGLTLILIILGAGWGLTIPLIKITVDADYGPFGIIFWQFLIGLLVLSALLWRRGARPPFGGRVILIWLFIAIIGTLVPNGASYRATFFLPAGVMAIIIASVPMMALPMALILRTDVVTWPRLIGLMAGLVGVALIALPEASLPDRAMAIWIPLALVAPFCYAVEGNFVGKWGTAPLDPVQVMWGACAVGVVMALPLALMTDQFVLPGPPFALADLTLLITAVIHVTVYTAYVWLVGRAGAVFAGQVAYLVTGFGVLWSMLLLGERYSLWVWAATALMLLGLALVQPRTEVDEPSATGDTAH